MHDIVCAADRTNCPSSPLHMLVACLGRQGHRAPWAGFCSVRPGAGDDGASRFASVDVVVMPCRQGAGPWSPTPLTLAAVPNILWTNTCKSALGSLEAGSQFAWFASYILSILNNPKAESPTAYLDSKLGPDARPGNGSHGPPPQVAQLIMATESHSFFTSIYSVPFG